MLFYNPNIRRKITYKIPSLFDEEQKDKKELYSYSIFTEDFKMTEIIFDEEKIKIYEYNPKNNFLDSLKVFDRYNSMINRFYFDIVNEIKDSNLANRRDSLILEFKESYNQRGRNVCHGYLDFKNDEINEFYLLSFHRIDCFLGERIKVKLIKNKEGDFIREEYYHRAPNGNLLYTLENEYEYRDSELEKKAQSILKNGWSMI